MTPGRPPDDRPPTGLTATVIELGEVSPGSAPEPPARPIRRVDIRRYGVAVIAVCCLLAVTGSARPEPRSLPVLWRLPFQGEQQFVLREDTLFRLEQGGQSTVTSYDAATGRIRWTRQFAQFASWMTTDTDGLLLLPGPESPADQTAVSTLAIDAGTGAVRWRFPGEAALAGRESVLLARWVPESDTLTSMRLVRAADGRVLWSLAPNSRIAGWATLGGEFSRPTRLVTVSEQGRIEVRRFDDGTLVTAGTVPWRITTPQGDEVAYLFGAADIVYTVRTVKGQQDIDAYQVDTLTRLWHVRTAAGYGMFDCGPVLCVNAEYAGVDGRDPRTGRVIWHGEGWDHAWPLTDGRLVAQSRDGGGFSLIAPDTGREIVKLGRAISVLEPEPGRVLAVALAESAASGSKLIELEPGGEVVLRGSLGRVSDMGCQAAAGRMACAVAGGELTVRELG